MIRPRLIKRKLLGLIWEDRPATAAGPRAQLVRAARILHVVVQDLRKGELTLQAMSLVYTTLLSLVPLLAVSFSVLKAFGVHYRLEPVLLSVLEPMGERGVEIAERIVGFVSNVSAGVLGSVGLAFLFYTVVSLMQKIERAFNFTWHVDNERSLAQRFSDYLSVVVVGPVLVFAAVGLAASAMSHAMVGAILAIPVLGAIFDAIGRLIPYLLVTVAFTVIYVFVPNTRVRLSSALAGGVVSALLWVTTGWVFTAFIAGSAKYTAIYSAFAGLVLFMIWLYLGWLILLTGASVAFYHQNPQYLRRHRGIVRLSNHDRERLALLIAAEVAQRFHRGAAPAGEAELSSLLRAPREAVQLVAGALAAQGLIRETASPRGYVPCRSLDQIPLTEVVGAVRRSGIVSDGGRMHKDPRVEAIAADLERAISATLGQTNLLDLVEREPATTLEARTRHG